jgi:LPXTG-site transpeptidase (sortase) family protein
VRVALVVVAAVASAVGGITLPLALSGAVEGDRAPAAAEERHAQGAEGWLTAEVQLPRAEATNAGVLESTPAPSPDTAAADAEDPAGAAVVAPAEVLATTSRIRIPSAGIDAPLTALGVGATGVMEAPADASSVGWYRFSAAPGAPGNALMSGHYDWVDRGAVFWQLQSLEVGDVVTIATDGAEFEYVVERTYSVPFNTTDVAPIVGSRSGRSTLTLITCDGAFNRATRQYEQRLVVVALLRAG